MTLYNRSLKGRNGKFTPMSEITIHDRIERFLDRKFRASRSYATKETYKGALNRFGDFAYQDYNQELNKLIDNMLNLVLDPIEVLDDFYTYLTKVENPQSKRIGEVMKQLYEMGYVTRQKVGKEYHYFTTSKKFENIKFNEIVFTELELESWLEAQGLKQL